jgi:periplasmic protein TonB
MSMVPPSVFVVDPGGRSSAELLRLLLVPAIAAVLYVSGIFWIRTHVSADPAGAEQNTTVQVRLLPRAAAVSIPIDPIPQPTTSASASRAQVVTDMADAAPDMAAPAPTKQALATDLLPPQIRSAPAPIETPMGGATTAKFQQALLRHVARYQHYPKAAQAARLHGVVDALFSMRRDGTLLGAWVKVSSGQGVLDKEALDAIRRAQPLPAIPPELPDQLNVRLTLVFDPT